MNFYLMLVIRRSANGTVTVFLLYSNDAGGTLFSLDYNGTEYYYLRNGQNYVVGFIDNSGNTVVEYHYDAWDKLI